MISSFIGAFLGCMGFRYFETYLRYRQCQKVLKDIEKEQAIYESENVERLDQWIK